MRLQQNISLWTRIKRAALAFDAWVNTALFEGGRGLGDTWDSYSRRVNCLRVRGAKRRRTPAFAATAAFAAPYEQRAAPASRSPSFSSKGFVDAKVGSPQHDDRAQGEQQRRRAPSSVA